MRQHRVVVEEQVRALWVSAVKKSVAQVQTIVNRWLPRLGLRHWDVLVRTPEGEMDHDDAIFEIQRHENAHRAILFVAPWLVNGEPHQEHEFITDEYVESSVVHELCHLHFRDIAFMVRDDLVEILGSVTGEMVMRQVSRFEEAAVDGLSRALVKSWPR